MLELKEENFDREVLQADGPVFVDFWGPHCGPCMELAPELEQLGAEYGDRLKMCKLNVLENRKLTVQQRVMGVPTVIVYQGGQKVEEKIGGEDCTPDRLEALIQKYI